MIREDVGFIGAGNMAEALIRGLLETRTLSPEQIVAADVNEIRLAHMARSYNIRIAASNQELARACPVLMLAVKPQQAREVLTELQGAMDPGRHVLISIAAGIPTDFLEKNLSKPIKTVRVMPNTPARLFAAASAFCLGQFAGEAESLLTRHLFDSVGLTVRVDEKLMNAVTALSGSGPAYVFKLCEMMIEAGRQLGLSEDDSAQLSVQTIYGAARMLKETGQDPSALRQAVTSPGGTTEAALRTLAASDFEQVFQEALKAARDRGAALAPKAEGA